MRALRVGGAVEMPLAISRKLCHMMAGSIEVESEPGQGTTFSVRLPREVHGNSPASFPRRRSVDEVAAVPSVEPNGYAVLVVDDDPNARDLATRILSRLGCRVVVAISADDGWRKLEAEQPDAVVACVGGGSNAMGIFYPYIGHEGTRLIGVEAAGEGLESGKHSASLQLGSPGVLHGNRTYILQDDNGQITETHSISAGLDYPGVGPEHAYLKDIGRAEYVGITDTEALEAFHYLCRTEGIIPALESSHAVAYAMKLAKTMRPEQSILVNLSGRGDKDIGTVADLSGADFFCRPSCQGQSVKGGSTATEQIVKVVQ